MIGILYIETDWDCGVKIAGVDYCDSKNTIPIYSIEDIKNAVFLGPFGSPLSSNTKLWEIKEAFACIIASPDTHFSNIGGNRGAEWCPESLLRQSAKQS